MKSPIILSNARYFRRFLVVRRSVLAMFLLGTILVFTDIVGWNYVLAYQSFALTAMGAMALYEWYWKPVFLEIQQSPSGLRGLSVYHPGHNFFHRFRAGEVKPLVIRPGDQLILHETDGKVPLFDKGRFTLRRSGEPEVIIGSVGLGWATPAERAALRRAVDEYFLDHRMNGRKGMELPLGN